MKVLLFFMTWTCAVSAQEANPQGRYNERGEFEIDGRTFDVRGVATQPSPPNTQDMGGAMQRGRGRMRGQEADTTQLQQQGAGSQDTNQSSRGAASGEQNSNMMTGGIQLGMGAVFLGTGYVMTQSSNAYTVTAGQVLMFMGASSAMSGITSLATAGQRQGNIDPLTPNSGGGSCQTMMPAWMCDTSGLNDNGLNGLNNGNQNGLNNANNDNGNANANAGNATAGNETGLNNGFVTNGSETSGGSVVPPDVLDAINRAKAEAAKANINLNDPKSLQKFAEKNGLGNLSASDMANAMNAMSPEQKAMVAKAKAELEKKFNIASLGDMGGGGGRGFGGGKGGKDFDPMALLESLKPKDRAPASTDGMQKLFNGEPIGVATDNIFEQVSRAYRAKIRLKKFKP